MMAWVPNRRTSTWYTLKFVGFFFKETYAFFYPYHPPLYIHGYTNRHFLEEHFAFNRCLINDSWPVYLKWHTRGDIIMYFLHSVHIDSVSKRNMECGEQVSPLQVLASPSLKNKIHGLKGLVTKRVQIYWKQIQTRTKGRLPKGVTH